MRKLSVILILIMVFSLGIVSAEKMICVDFDNPSSIYGLNYNVNSNLIHVSWDESIDTPSCSGIDYYEIYLNGSFFLTTNLNYFDFNNTEDYYDIRVRAVDFAGNIGSFGFLEINSIDTDNDFDSGDSRFGGHSYILECLNWSGCVGGTQFRECSYGKTKYNQTRNCHIQNLTSNINKKRNFEEKENNQTLESIDSERTGFSRITGRAVDGVSKMSKKPKIAIPTFGIILFLGIFFLYKKRYRNKGSFSVKTY